MICRSMLRSMTFLFNLAILKNTSAVTNSAMRLNRIPADVWLLSSEVPTSEENSAARGQLIVLIASELSRRFC
jgi:hypothetical protein